MTWRAWLIIVPALILVSLPGYLVKRVFFSSTQEKMGWTAEMFFDGPPEIALCKAIERNDLAKMKKLIAEGANVNERGKGNVTPLLWAMFDQHPERFQLLLEHGANPNGPLTEPLSEAVTAGMSVTELAARTRMPGYFELVMKNGGDPNLVNPVTKEPLLCMVIHETVDTIPRLKLLLEKGADINCKDGRGSPATFRAISWFNQYDVALFLLESGADPKAVHERYQSLLIDNVLGDVKSVRLLSQRRQAEHKRLLDWLLAHGESIEESKRRRDEYKKKQALQFQNQER